MIKFFRRIRQRLLSENKFRKYLLYAIGEIVLVVIGILIALAINNKNEQRQIDEQTRLFLVKLKSQIDKNREEVAIEIEKNTMYLNISKKYLPFLGQNPITMNDSQLDSLILVNVFDFNINMDMITLEQAQLNGSLDLVPSDSLRQSLYSYIKLYDFYKEREKIVNEDLNIHFKPYLNRHFNIRNLIDTYGIYDFGQSSLHENNSSKILLDPEFENLIITRIVNAQEILIDITEVQDMITLIEEQLSTALN